MLLTGCTESHPDEAKAYVESANMKLYQLNICLDQQDCLKRKVIFYAGGSILTKNYPVISIYGVHELEKAKIIERSLKEKRKEMPIGLKLFIYSTQHNQSEKLLLESVID
jgi:hypothetical protein